MFGFLKKPYEVKITFFYQQSRAACAALTSPYEKQQKSQTLNPELQHTWKRNCSRKVRPKSFSWVVRKHLPSISFTVKSRTHYPEHQRVKQALQEPVASLTRFPTARAAGGGLNKTMPKEWAGPGRCRDPGARSIPRSIPRSERSRAQPGSPSPLPRRPRSAGGGRSRARLASALEGGGGKRCRGRGVFRVLFWSRRAGSAASSQTPRTGAESRCGVTIPARGDRPSAGWQSRRGVTIPLGAQPLLPFPFWSSSESRARSPTLQRAHRSQHEPDGRGEQPRPLLRQGLQGKRGRGSVTRAAGLAGAAGMPRPRSPLMVPKPTAERVSPAPRSIPALSASPPSLGEVQHLYPAPAPARRVLGQGWLRMAPSLQTGVTLSGWDPGGCWTGHSGCWGLSASSAGMVGTRAPAPNEIKYFGGKGLWSETWDQVLL